ncbi:MAG: LPS export ABC transporter periplasmic protein LptC [Nitrospiraceae bacterium]|nr:MAG: LPS export ABC transporter periplasmic protein LptC [Nitrospiraceae bacterium]
MFKTRLIWILSALFAVGILILLTYDGNRVGIMPSYQSSYMTDLHMKHREGGEVKWELTSDRAVLPINRKEVHLEKIALKIRQSPEIDLTSGSGVYEVDEGNIMLSDTVNLNVKDAVFSTASVRYTSRDESIVSEETVRLTGNNFTITGSGLAAQVKEEKVSILHDVKAVFYH